MRVEAARAAVDARRHRKEAARWEAHAFTLQQCAPGRVCCWQPVSVRVGLELIALVSSGDDCLRM